MDFNVTYPDNVLAELGKRCKAHRLNCQMTQEELAVKTGMSKNAISKFERGIMNISILNLLYILRPLGLANQIDLVFPELPDLDIFTYENMIEKIKKHRIKK